MVQQNADQAVHEAARAGLADKLAAMLATDVSLIDAKGIDARTPLHCAGTVAVAALLLDNGARIDARDEDHDSTRGVSANRRMWRSFCWSEARERTFFSQRHWVIWRWPRGW
jgi:hypothetical protein